MILTGHVLHEDSLTNQAAPHGSVMRYYEYMDYLEDKHGGPELFKIKKKSGLIDDYIPPKPRIKGTKELKFLKKNKIILGTVGRFLIDDEKLDDIIKFYSVDMNVDNITVEQSRDKTAEKILDGGTSKKYKNIKSQKWKTIKKGDLIWKIQGKELSAQFCF